MSFEIISTSPRRKRTRSSLKEISTSSVLSLMARRTSWRVVAGTMTLISL